MEKRKQLVSVQDIYCGYDNTEIIHGISFAVFENERLSILGPNGCGKTTLLRVLNALIPFQGDVRVEGKALAKMNRRDIAGLMVYMSQMNAVYFPYTVYETVMMGRYAHRRGLFDSGNKRDEEAVIKSLEQTGTLEIKDKLLNELSGGQFQRVMLARVFAQSPHIILLDEPTNHLDLKYQIQLMEYLDKWVKDGARCVISVLHDINMALAFSDRILLMDEGRRVHLAPAKDFPIQKINDVYGMDIGNYMRAAHRFWE